MSTVEETPRDARVAQIIERAKDSVSDLEGLVGQMVEHANANGATAHAGLYERVRLQLWMAAQIIGYAHEAMANDDPGEL